MTHTWQRYAAAALTAGVNAKDAAELADEMVTEERRRDALAEERKRARLAERRQRFAEATTRAIERGYTGGC